MANHSRNPIRTRPRLLVLPSDICDEARILSLPSPATHRQNRYLHCPERGLYEFKKVSDHKHVPRSWLIVTPNHTPTHEIDDEDSTTQTTVPLTDDKCLDKDYISKGFRHVCCNACGRTLLYAADIESSKNETKGREKQLFLTLEDHLDAAAEKGATLRHITQHPKARRRIENRLRHVCDTVEAGEDSMYRLSTEKLFRDLIRRATAIVESGLPASMEDRFIKQALRAPVLNVSSENSADAKNAQPQSQETDGGSTPDTQGMSENSSISQTSTCTEQSSATSVTSMSDSNPGDATLEHAPENVTRLLRLRTALTFIMSSYLPANIRSILSTMVKTNTAIDFAPLDAHLSHLSELRAKALAQRSVMENISRKRAFDDDEAAEERAEKKRKKEEDEKKKKAESRALKDLKKVDLSGMKKLSSFFQKVPKKT